MFKPFNAAKRFGAKVAAAAGGVMSSGLAMAQTSDLTTGFKATVDSHEAELWALGAIVLGVVAVSFIIARAKRAGGN